jgi:7-carboxy-7-deazaguanine synthase
MLRVANIFTSIDGEVNSFGQGTFSTFIRVSGCNLKCRYCDTSWSQNPDYGKLMHENKIMDIVQKIECNKVTITGGEPLLQDISLLLNLLIENGNDISIETNGTILLPKNYINNVSWIVDRKIGEDFKYENLPLLSGGDFIKIIVWDEKSYMEAKQFYGGNAHLTLANFAFSPLLPILPHALLCEWMIKDKLFDVKLNCQIHKFIWSRENNNVFAGIEH